MTDARWQRTEQVLHAALEREEPERAAFLREACAGDEQLRREIESLLAGDRNTEGFLNIADSRSRSPFIAEDPVRSLIGHQIGTYHVRALLGVGGMGEVYRAHDTKLGRDVAIKVLPQLVTADADRLARFKREARVLATLNHPNIGAIYGFEDIELSTGSGEREHALVLELVEGQTLAEKLAQDSPSTRRLRLGLEQALDIARQIADALDAAHDKGIVHRDLKPANIKITPEGRVKVLDFGLAKAATADETISEGPTRAGMILGTPAYMSPEQACGKTVDKRTDIWAFGCVLYEMLTGRLTFAGETASEAIAAILGSEPDWNALPDGTPTGIRRLLQRCLDKDSKRRLRDIGDARMELDDTLSGSQGLPISTAGQGLLHRSTASWYVAAAAVLSALIAAFAAWNLKPAPPTAPESLARFILPMPAGVGLLLDRFGSDVTVSPDGRHVAFVGRRTGQLYMRTIRDADTKILTGTEGAQQPFFSPDSRWLAFFAGGSLKKVPTAGGVPIIVCDAPGSRGGFWSEDGTTIVFSPLSRGSGILQVSADGGATTQITALDVNRGETSHRLPELLPGGETILFAVYGATYQDVSIVAQSLKTGERQVLIEGASLPHYVASSGHLLYLQPKRPGTIMAVAFDPETLRFAGTPVAVVEGVLTARGDYAHWSVARSGVLVYAPGGFKEPERNLVFVDRKGVAAPVGTPLQRPYAFPRLSPDGSRVVVTLQGIQSTLWLYDLASGIFTRLTFEGNNNWAAWTPDGKRVTYASNRAEPWRLFWKQFDGSGTEEMLLAKGAGQGQQPYSWSADGKVLVYADGTPEVGQNIWALPMDGDRQPRPILQTPDSEVDARLSPDGRWLAYASDESGHYEVYVQPFSGSGGKWQISADGGREPVWARSGREIFYRNGEKMMAASVATEPTFKPATSRLLFQGPYERTNTLSPSYDVTVDDERFLMVQQSEQQSPPDHLNVVLNWTEELKRLVPTR